MQINFKHVAATAMAAAMSLSLAVPAFAAGNGGDKTLTVTGNTLDNKNVYAVQMFTARVTAGTGSDTFDSYELADAWMPFFQDDTDGIGKTAINVKLTTDKDPDNNGLVLGDTPTNEQWENAILAYMEAQEKDGKDLIDLANKAQAWVRSHDGQPIEEPTEFANKIITATADNDTAQFTDLKPGYYLIYPEGGSTGTGSRGTDAMLVNVPRDEEEAALNIKSTYPTVEKKVDTDGDGEGSNPAADNGSAQVGDVVTFTLTSQVPDMSDYTTFYFAFNDTLSNGLEFVKDGNTAVTTDVTVTIGEELITSGYTVSLDGTALKVVFEDLKSVAGDPSKVGKDIVVTYQAMITKEAVVGTPALNTVKVEYSNDPTTNTKGESTPDESKVYTYEISVNKYADGAVDLAGAKFKLTTDKQGNNAINLVATDEAQVDGTHNAYQVAEPGEESSVTEFVTNSFGDIKISGLKVGIYYLHEIEAPAGYNKLKAPVKIEIVVNDDNYANATIQVDGEEIDSNGTIVDVENKKGIELPETGSIGTIGLTVAGVAIVLLGVFAPRKKKKSNQE